ncbi:MAG: OsmC family protein [Kiritimatiellae bacterium]|nr:OsmC family protein [Kiritimatiellia bacterium]
MKNIKVTFPGGNRVDAHYEGRTVKTDQSVKNGGEGSAPEPFDLFFVSIATCAGIYALDFCDRYKLNSKGLGITLNIERDSEKKMFSPVNIEVTLPEDFPEKHKKTILKTINICTVIKHIVTAPKFNITLAPTSN